MRFIKQNKWFLMGLKKYMVLIGILIFAFILINIELEKVFFLIIQANSFLITSSIILIVLGLIVKGLKWKTVVKSFETKISTRYTMKNTCSVSHFSASLMEFAKKPGYINCDLNCYFLNNFVLLYCSCNNDIDCTIK